MLQVKKIKKIFAKQVNKKEKIKFLANDNICLEAKKGEILGILGPNGAGKTTLLRMIAGIMEPTEGEITIDNESYKDNAEIDALIAAYLEIKPREVMLYSIDRKTPEENLEKVNADELQRIADRMRAAGITVQVNA